MTQRMMWVTWEDGAKLSKSQKSPGDYSPLTRDADKQLGQVVLSDIDDHDAVPGAGPTSLDSFAEEESPSSRANREPNFSDVVAEAMAEVAAEVMRELLEAAVEAAKPHVARWWNDQARPAISSAAQATRNRFRKTKSRSAGSDVVPAEEIANDDNPTQLESHDESAAVMTMVEAEQRLTAALVARAFSDEQVRTVLNARIVDEDQQEMQLSLKEVPRDEIELQVRQLLEANPTMLESLIELFADTQTRSEPALIEQP